VVTVDRTEKAWVFARQIVKPVRNFLWGIWDVHMACRVTSRVGVLERDECKRYYGTLPYFLFRLSILFVRNCIFLVSCDSNAGTSSSMSATHLVILQNEM